MHILVIKDELSLIEAAAEIFNYVDIDAIRKWGRHSRII